MDILDHLTFCIQYRFYHRIRETIVCRRLVSLNAPLSYDTLFSENNSPNKALLG